MSIKEKNAFAFNKYVIIFTIFNLCGKSNAIDLGRNHPWGGHNHIKGDIVLPVEIFQITFSYPRISVFFFFHFLLSFNYSCPHFLPLLSPDLPTSTSHIQSSPPHCLCPWVLYTCSLTTLPLLSPITFLPPPLWLLSVCSLFPCLWFYFARLLVLLIRFQL